MKSTQMWLCECGNVYDDYETYEKGFIQTYGKTKKPLYGHAGKPMLDDNGEQVYGKCHECRTKHGWFHRPPRYSCIDRVLEYLKDNEFVTSDMYQRFGFHSKSSFASTMAIHVKDGKIHTKRKGGKNQKYYLTITK